MPDDQEQQLENDMDYILAGFKNLKSVHLSPVFFASIDPKYLLSACQNLVEIKILRKQGAAQ